MTAGTNRAKAEAAAAARPGPTVVLVDPQLGENVGTAARAMLNCGLYHLRLVRPRDGWPNPRAWAAASGAGAVLDAARCFGTAADAVADCTRVYAATARHRGMLKEVLTPREAARRMRAEIAAGERVAVLFGPERTGLESDDVVRANCQISVPLNPGFASLNLAQAVMIIGYEWFTAGDETPPAAVPARRTQLATKADLEGFMRHLADELDASGYFANIADKRESMLRNIRNIFERVPLYEQDIRTLRGIVKALAIGRPTRPRPRSRRVSKSTD